MANPKCETCRWRARYDNNPKSFIGRLWRWHAAWCPGWKAYMQSLSDDARLRLADTYRLSNYLKPAGSRQET
jgi:hypothetical protein